MFKRVVRWAGLFVGAGVIAVTVCYFGLVQIGVASAETLQSNSYKFEESVLGGGGLIQSNSNNYQVNGSFGESIQGPSASTNFQAVAGNTTTKDPALSVTINNPNANFGAFSPGAAATSTSVFSISNYTSYGYAVQIMGNVPTNGAHTIDAMATTGPSVAGQEQFGINLVANTSPTSLGANPNQGQFGFGVAAPNYATSDQYRYVSGETIATAPKSSGVTVYTISYIVNVDNLTPGGQYGTHQTIICTGTY